MELELKQIQQTPLFTVPKGLWAPNLAGWWFRMRELHPQSHVDIVVTWQIKKLYIHFHKAYGPQTQPVGNLRWGDPTHKVTWRINHVVTRQNKNVLCPHSQGPWPPKLGRVLNQDEGTTPKNSRDTSIVRSGEKLKTSYLLNNRGIEM